jgi:hypothetical protein
MRIADSKFEKLFLSGDEAVALAATEILFEALHEANLQAFALGRGAGTVDFSSLFFSR